MQKLVASKPSQVNQEKFEVNTLQSNTGKSKPIELTTPFEMFTATDFRKEIA